jgi:protein-tyrosine phosphatase
LNTSDLRPQPGAPGTPGRRAKRLLLFVLLLGAVGAIGIGIKVGSHALLPKRFAVVEEGQLYRSGYCEPRPLRQIIRERKLKSILVLLVPIPGSTDQDKEETVAREEGVQIIQIPMPGDGRGDFDSLDLAAATIADPANRPMLVHCAAGVNRTGAAYAAWRMKYGGWSFEKALAEMERYGYSEKDTPKLKEHLQRYYAERVAGKIQKPDGQKLQAHTLPAQVSTSPG